jgi:hypothetical protein
MFTFVEELLARDLVVIDRVDRNFLADDALSGGFGGDVESEVDGELTGTGGVKERAGYCLAIDGFVEDPAIGFLDDWTLAAGLFAVAFDGDDCRRVRRAHDVEVLALAALLNKLLSYFLKTHLELRSN